MSLQAWFSGEDMAVIPGGQLTLALTIRNLGELTESYTIVPEGPSAGWITVGKGNLTLFAGSQEVVHLEIVPPALSTTTAGPTAIVVRVIPRDDADGAIVAEATIAVDPFDNCELVPLQSVQRARRRATYEFMVENRGNSLASCRLRLVDPTDRIDGSFDPPAVGLAPGSGNLVQLKARAKRGVFRRGTRTIDFEVEAERQGHPPATTTLALVQSATIPRVAVTRFLILLALLGGLALAWFALVEPAIEEAVADQVDQRIAEMAPASTEPERADSEPTDSVPVTQVATTAPITAPDTAADGDPTFFRLSVLAPITETVDQSQTMADGETFDMTDVRVENPFNDRGVATLSVNGEQVFIWSLENIRGQLFEPRITPIRLQPGDEVIFSVRCDQIGDPTRVTCTDAINIGGIALPIDDS